MSVTRIDTLFCAAKCGRSEEIAFRNAVVRIALVDLVGGLG